MDGRFQIGSEWIGAQGKVFSIKEGPTPDGYYYLVSDSGIMLESLYADEVGLNKYFTRIPDKIPPCDDPDLPSHLRADSLSASPIRTIIRKEIVPGTYGRLNISDVEPGTEPEFGGVCIRLVNREGRMHDGGSDPALMTPDELDAAASVLTQIAAVLRENQ
jgi:hypothetical protein